jgi:hypothetical protein
MSKYTIKSTETGLVLIPDPNGHTLEQIQKVLLPHYTVNQLTALIKK